MGGGVWLLVTVGLAAAVIGFVVGLVIARLFHHQRGWHVAFNLDTDETKDER